MDDLQNYPWAKHTAIFSTLKLITRGLLLQLKQPGKQQSMGNIAEAANQWVAICAQAAHG